MEKAKYLSYAIILYTIILYLILEFKFSVNNTQGYRTWK